MEYFFNEEKDCSKGNLEIPFSQKTFIGYKAKNFCMDLKNLSLLINKSESDIKKSICNYILNGHINAKNNIRYYGINTGKLISPINNDIFKVNMDLLPDDEQAIIYFSLNIVIKLINDYYPSLYKTMKEFLDNQVKRMNQFNYMIVAVICGCDESINKINFGKEYSLVKMGFPKDKEFIHKYWYIDNVINFSNYFKDALISGGQDVICVQYNNLFEIEKIEDTTGKLIENFCELPVLKKYIDKIMNIFKAIRLKTQKPVWVKELLRSCWFTAWGQNNILHGKQIENFDKNNLFSFKKDYNFDNINLFIKDFYSFLNNKFLKLCIEHYDNSFFVEPKVGFIELAICLEILFHPGDKDELKNRISRNACVFLGRDLEESNLYYDKIRKIYDIRSKLVHTGEIKHKNGSKSPYSKQEIIQCCNEARIIVSKSIIKYKYSVVDKDIDRKVFFNTLMKSGFGENPFDL